MQNISRRGFVKASGITAAGLGVSSLLAACGGSSSDASADGIAIGVMGPYSGDVAQYGIAVRNGIDLYFKLNPTIGGIEVTLYEEDEKGDATEAANVYNKLVEEGVCAIIGDVTSTPTIAVAQASAVDNLPCVTPSATAEAVVTYGDNYFRACFTDPYQGKLMADFAAQQGYTSVGCIYNTGDDYSTGVQAAFEEEAAAQNITITDAEGYSNGEVDFNSMLTSIIATNPDAIFAPNYYQDDGKIVTQARQQGYTGPILGVDGWSNIVSSDQSYASAEDLEGCFYCCGFNVAADTEAAQQFVSDYEAEYGTTPGNFDAMGYDAALVTAEAIASVVESGTTDLTSDDGRQAIIDAIKNGEFEGVAGSISYPENGDPAKSTMIITFNGGAEELFTTMEYQA